MKQIVDHGVELLKLGAGDRDRTGTISLEG
jgi:hypothetical protein